jgi:hypothetical protein
MLFRIYRTKKEIDEIKEDVRQLRSLVDEFLDMITKEEQEGIISIENLQDLPDIDKEILLEKLSRKLEEAKQIADKYMVRIEETERKIHVIEERLPPRRGLNRLLYLNPWILVLIGIGIIIILFALTGGNSKGDHLSTALNLHSFSGPQAV